jgi:hypothetical protein
MWGHDDRAGSTGRTRFARAVALAALTLAATAVPASALSEPPLPDPELRGMALAASDFRSGAKAIADQALQAEAGAVATGGYVRMFGPGARLGKDRLLLAGSIVVLYREAETAALDLRDARAEVGTKAGRNALARSFVAGYMQGSKGPRPKVTVGKPASLGLGPSSFRLPLVVRAREGTIRLTIAMFVVDRAAAMTFVASLPGKRLAAADTTRAARAVHTRFRRSFTVANSAPPTIVGTAQEGQVLTATRGDWRGAPSGVTYQWSRCDAAGATCAAIAGATAQTYVVAAGDRGAALKVTVTAANTVSSVSALSAATTPGP